MKNNQQLVSVIIPAYNSSDYIENCINSLLRQTYKKIEIIVIDDGSTDDTYSIIEKYSDKIKIVKKMNTGVSDTRNKRIRIFDW